MGVLDDISDVQRLRLEPGDALVVRVRGQLSPASADEVKARVRALLGLDDSTPVLVLPEGGSIELLDPVAQNADLIRRAMEEATAHPGRAVTVEHREG